MNISISLNSSKGKVNQYWTKCVGSCHAATALRADWRNQLKICREEFGFEYVRFHGLLNDDMSVCLRKRDGSLGFSFFNVDSIFDFLLSIGMKPFIELSFMPTALASGSTTVMHYRANITPPVSYDEWAELIGALTSHLVERYGAIEVRKWFFEVWNEPNLDLFWTGTMQEYFQLYKSAALAIKKVDSELAVGGPATAIDAWIPELREFCGDQIPLDFISSHHYPTDAAYGIGLDMEEQMARSKRGVVSERLQKALEEADPLPVYYTEWNNSPSPRDSYHDDPYNAAFTVKTITDNLKLPNINQLKCYSYWAFSDIFEESGFSSIPFHGGFGLTNIHGIPKPVYRSFQMLSKLNGDFLETIIEGGQSTVDCFASQDQDKVTILLSNYQMPLSPIKDEQVQLHIKGIAGVKSAILERIDETHANPKRVWIEMGSPIYLNNGQIDTLMNASELAQEVVDWSAAEEGINIELVLKPDSATAVYLVLEN